MIRDLLQDATDIHAADICIVGAGAAGIVLAVALIRRGKRVLLLEGGGREVEKSSQHPYASDVVGLPHRGVHSGRYRAMGGTTTKWGGQILELDAQDFEDRSAVPGGGWPFDKEDLTPFYERALAFEGLAGVLRHDDDVWRMIGIPKPSFDRLEPYFSRWCPEPNFARLHMHTLEEHPALTLWLHANAVQLVFEGDRASGVRCRTLTGIERTYSAEHFVFCLGAIESSRFFLQPRQGGIPWNHSGLLGKHFQDHIDCNAAAIEPVDRKRFHNLFDNIYLDGYKYHPKLRLASQVQQQDGTLNVAATMSFEGDMDKAGDRLKATAKKFLRRQWREIDGADLLLVGSSLPLLSRQMWRYQIHHRAYNRPDARIYLRVHCEQQPGSASSISLSNRRDAFGLYQTRLNWQISDLEITTIRRYVQVAQASLAEIARVVPHETLMNGDGDLRRQCVDSNHHMGGMRMHARSHSGVVDPNLRLHCTHNVYVCSSAVFPSSGFSNPTHTLLALAVRLADHLTQAT